MRTISAALQEAFDATSTSIGYLIQVNASQIYRWSNIGLVSWQPPELGGAVPWSPVAFKMSGLAFDATQDPAATLEIDNKDNTIFALFQNENMADVLLDVYQFSRTALGVSDVPYLVQMAIAGLQADLNKVTVNLVAYSSLSAFSPRRRIDSVNGFNLAIAPGVQIPWGNENFILEEDTNSG